MFMLYVLSFPVDERFTSLAPGLRRSSSSDIPIALLDPLLRRFIRPAPAPAPGDRLPDLPHDPLAAEVDGLQGPDAVVGAAAPVAPVAPPTHAAPVPVAPPVPAHPAPRRLPAPVVRPVPDRVAARAPRARFSGKGGRVCCHGSVFFWGVSRFSLVRPQSLPGATWDGLAVDVVKWELKTVAAMCAISVVAISPQKRRLQWKIGEDNRLK